MAGPAFSLLGPMRAWRDGRELDLGSPQQRLVLAVLLLGRGEPVHVDKIAGAVWEARAPRAASTTIRTYVSRLRAALGEGDDQVILSTAGGYALPVGEDAVDVRRFRAAVVSAEEARRRGDAEQAVQLSRAALHNWRGVPLAGMRGEYTDRQRELLLDGWVDAVELAAALELELGEAPGMIGRLTEAVGLQPLRERLHELLILGLHRSGRQAEALNAYANVRTLLREDLGIEPGADLRRAYARMLAESRPDADETSQPPRLPPDLAVFVGRRAEIETMSQVASRATARLVLVIGMAGVGKTTLALHWAHRVADEFPDGQIHVDLRAFGPHDGLLSTSDALAAVLESLGFPAGRLPDDLDARASLYRSVLAERRCLIVLDNARSSEQVMPLLPGGSPSVVVVTSRMRLCGLVTATGTPAVYLNALSRGEARELLGVLVGRGRVATEPTAVERIVTACGGLPLALSVVGGRAAGKPGFSLDAIATELYEAGDSLDAFAGAGGRGDVRSVLSWSYRELSPRAADLLALLTLCPGMECTVAAAASLAGMPVRATRVGMRELAYASLVSDDVPGRYRWHELVRGYALEAAADRWTAGERVDALRRLCDHYLASVHHATARLSDRSHLARLPPAENVSVTTFDSAVQALDWFRAEYSTMQALVEQSAAAGLATHGPRLAWYLRRFRDRWGRQETDVVAVRHRRWA